MKTGELYRFLNSTLTMEELAELCRMLDVDIENLSGNTRKMKAMSLEDYLTRRGRLDEAVPAAAELFPDLDLTPVGGRAALPRDNAPAPAVTPPSPTPVTAAGAPAAPRVERFPYENFDIHVRAFGNEQYTVEASWAGSESGSVTQPLPLADAQGAAWVAALREGALDGEQAEAMGRALYAWLFPGPVDKALHAARSKARYLRLRLRLDPHEISRLPWEFVYHPDDGFLAQNRELPIVRYLAESFSPRWDRSSGAVRLLAVGASPPDHEPLDVAGELARLETAVGPLGGQISLKPLPNATFTALHDALTQGVDVFHFIGHGVQKERGGKHRSYLVLEGEDGEESQEIDADVLRALVQSRNIKLAMLNACSSAQSEASEAAMGLAPALMRAQVPAVIAMQAPVSDRAALRLSKSFYGLLAQGYPLDTAVAEMRLALLPLGEWGTPVLFMRAPDGILWTGMDAPEAATTAPARGGGVNISGISNSSISIGGSVVGGDLTQGR